MFRGTRELPLPQRELLQQAGRAVEQLRAGRGHGEVVEHDVPFPGVVRSPALSTRWRRRGARGLRQPCLLSVEDLLPVNLPAQRRRRRAPLRR